MVNENNTMIKYVFDRLSEASTWRGLIALAVATGIAFSPEQVEAIIATGLAIVGLVGVLFPDHIGKG